MNGMERRHLAQADRHIAECKVHIARQQKIILQLAGRGQPTNWAKDTLKAFEMSLRAFERRRKLIVSAIDAEQQR